MHHQPTQRGYILLPVVLMITVIAAIAFLINNDTNININMTAAAIEAEKVEQVAHAGLAHATWGAQNSGCAGDMAMTTVPFGQGGTGSYTATVDATATTTAKYTFTPDRDGIIEEKTPDHNHSGDATIKVKNKPGDIFHALYHYDLSSIPSNQKVVTATAWFYVDTEDSEGPVTLHPVTADWTEAGLSWDAVGGQFESGIYGSFPAQPVKDVWVSVNVTALAQSWVSNPGSNHGFLLNATSVDVESKYTSREYGTASQRPYLAVTTADAAVSPVAISATGTLTGNPSPANDITRTLTRTAIPAWQPPGERAFQPGPEGTDTYIYEWKPGWNYGASTTLWAENRFANSIANGLLRFDLAGLPRGARVTSALLALYQTDNSLSGGPVGVHRVTSAWVEGTNNGANGSPNWTQRDATNAWASAGGDYTTAAFATTTVPAGTGWSTWDIAGLVNGWVSGEFTNNGLALVAGTFGTAAHFASSDAADPALHPKLTLTYACECGNPCLAPQGSGTVLMVVVDPTSLVPADAYKKALFESWGYTVNLIGENANAAAYMSSAASNDVFYISETVNSAQVGNRIKDVPIGVVSEDGDYNSGLGLATGSGHTIGSALNVTDTSHYITKLFSAGPLDIYSAGMEQLTVSGTEAPGLQTLADTGGAGSLVVLDKGADMAGGGTAAGRRVMLPLGRVGKFNWDYLNGNGRLLVQRALQWGTGNTGEAPSVQLLFVAAGTTPTAQEQLRIDLIESWGYGVTVIDDNDSQANFDVAVAANDVAYVSSTVSDAALGTKLKAAAIGVVNENMPMAQTFGFASGYQTYARDQIRVTDNSHHITYPLALGYLPIFTSLQTVYQRGSTAGDVVMLADSFNIGTDANNKPSLLVINTGGALDGGGTAAGRRVQLPWGSNTFNVAALNADGQGIMQRAIEWAEAAAPPVTYTVLLVVVDPASLTAQEATKMALMESWGYTVTLIDDSASQADFDTAAAIADVAYVAEDIETGQLNTKLREVTIGVVNEEEKITDEFGICSGDTTFTEASIEITDNTHYITEPFSLGAVAFASSAQPVGGRAGTLAPGLVVLAQQPSTSTSMLDVIETGGVLFDTGTAAGRRVTMPWGGNDFDINSLTADGLIIMRRALEWGVAGGGGGGGGVPDVTVTLTSVQDTQARAGTTLAYGSSPSMSLNAGSPVIRPLLQFDVSSIAPGTVITSATLRLNQATLIYPGTMIAKARKVTEVWNEKWGGSNGANWTNRFKQGGTTLLWATPGVTFDPAWESQTTFDVVAGEWVEWDITPLVQEWVDGANNGVVIEPITVGPYVNFHTSDGSDPALDPQLVITHP